MRTSAQAAQLRKAASEGWGAVGSDAADAAPPGAQSSAGAALRAHHAVQRWVALAQLRRVCAMTTLAPPSPYHHPTSPADPSTHMPARSRCFCPSMLYHYNTTPCMRVILRAGSVAL